LKTLVSPLYLTVSVPPKRTVCAAAACVRQPNASPQATTTESFRKKDPCRMLDLAVYNAAGPLSTREARESQERLLRSRHAERHVAEEQALVGRVDVPLGHVEAAQDRRDSLVDERRHDRKGAAGAQK
jgi:hypothetical protein